MGEELQIFERGIRDGGREALLEYHNDGQERTGREAPYSARKTSFPSPKEPFFKRIEECPQASLLATEGLEMGKIVCWNRC